MTDINKWINYAKKYFIDSEILFRSRELLLYILLQIHCPFICTMLRELLLFWEIVIRVFLPFFSSGGGRNAMSATLPNPSAIETVWAQLRCIHPPSILSRQFFFLLSIDISAVHAISDTTSPDLEGYAARYRWYLRIFRPTNNIRLYLFAIAISKYLEVRCYGQPYVISAFAYRSSLLFPFFSYVAMCGICGSFTYFLLTSREERREYIWKHVYMSREIWSVLALR